ncbi:hypothetical protein ACFPM0_07775 [Pseudonocardia sulfidoxydans]
MAGPARGGVRPSPRGRVVSMIRRQKEGPDAVPRTRAQPHCCSGAGSEQ